MSNNSDLWERIEKLRTELAEDRQRLEQLEIGILRVRGGVQQLPLERTALEQLIAEIEGDELPTESP